MAKKHKENMISIPSSLAGLVERAQGVQTIPAMPPIGGRREDPKEEKPAAEAAAPVPAHETAAPTQSETAPVQSASAPTRQETAPAQQPSAPNGRPAGEEVASPAVAPPLQPLPPLPQTRWRLLPLPVRHRPAILPLRPMAP